MKVHEEGMTIKEASQILQLNYFSAKTVMRTYAKYGRIRKKITRDRHKSKAVTPPAPSSSFMDQQGIRECNVRGSLNPSTMRSEMNVSEAFHVPIPQRLTAGTSEKSSSFEVAGSKSGFNFTVYSREILEMYTRRQRQGREYFKSGRMLPLPKCAGTL